MKNIQIDNSQDQILSENIHDDSGYVDSISGTSLFLTNEEEQQSLKELNNRFSRYIEHIKQKEITKSNKTVEELIQIPSIQLDNLKDLYESEIQALRDALNEKSNSFASLQIENSKLLADNANNQLLIKEKLLQITQISESLQNSESENARLKKQLHILQNKESLADALADQLKNCQDQLEKEVLLRTTADNVCLTLKEKFDFSEAVFKKELGATMTAYKSTLDKLTFMKNNIDNYNLLKQLEQSRDTLRDYLNEFRESINNDFLHTIKQSVNSIGDQINTRSKSRQTNDELLAAQNSLIIELEKIRSSHVTLENQLSDIQTLSEAEIDRLRRLVSELSEKSVDDLKVLFNKLKNVQCSLGEKAFLDSELAAYRSMLDAEEQRTNLSSPPISKRRKIVTDKTDQPKSILKASRKTKTCLLM